MIRRSVASLFIAFVVAIPGQIGAVPIPSGFASSGDDRRAIQTLLDTYTRAVSSKDEATAVRRIDDAIDLLTRAGWLDTADAA